MSDSVLCCCCDLDGLLFSSLAGATVLSGDSLSVIPVTEGMVEGSDRTAPPRRGDEGGLTWAVVCLEQRVRREERERERRRMDDTDTDDYSRVRDRGVEVR